MKRVIFIAMLAAIFVSGCSRTKDGNATAVAAATAPVPHYTITSPVKFSDDPAKKHEQQQELVNTMVADNHVDLDNLRGEAMRRGITLTPEQIAKKKAQTPETGVDDQGVQQASPTSQTNQN